MNLFDELCKDAASDIESGVYMNVSQEQKTITDAVDRMLQEQQACGEAGAEDNPWQAGSGGDQSGCSGKDRESGEKDTVCRRACQRQRQNLQHRDPAF